MKPHILILAIICAALLSACGPTKYTSKSDAWTHEYGYDDTPLDSTTWRVNYTGDASMSSDLVDRYALYRAAELTVEKHYDYFVIIDGMNDASTYSSTMNGATTHSTQIEHDIDPQTGKMIPVAVTTSSPNYMVLTGTNHSVTRTIRLFKGQRPAENTNAYDAKSMLTMMGPTISR